MTRIKTTPGRRRHMRQMIARATFLTMLGLGSFSAALAEGAARRCSAEDFQACRSCPQLSAAIDLKSPMVGDYYRGAEWNGLFAAYVLNCPMVGARLIRAGADPAIGGANGSMILTVASKWPHNNRQINEAWAAMLLAAGASMATPLPSQSGKSTSQMLLDEAWAKPDYVDLLTAFQR